jgi:hypothetical protein
VSDCYVVRRWRISMDRTLRRDSRGARLASARGPFREACRVKMHGERLYFLQLHDGAGSLIIGSPIEPP